MKLATAALSNPEMEELLNLLEAAESRLRQALELAGEIAGGDDMVALLGVVEPAWATAKHAILDAGRGSLASNNHLK